MITTGLYKKKGKMGLKLNKSKVILSWPGTGHSVARKNGIV
jgi:hypothetical protein